MGHAKNIESDEETEVLSQSSQSNARVTARGNTEDRGVSAACCGKIADMNVHLV